MSDAPIVSAAEYDLLTRAEFAERDRDSWRALAELANKRADDLRSQLGKAKAVLAPFASAADGLINNLPDDYQIVLKVDAATPFAVVKAREFRAARNLLSDDIPEWQRPACGCTDECRHLPNCSFTDENQNSGS